MKTRDNLTMWKTGGAHVCPSPFAAFHGIGVCKYSLCQYDFTVVTSFFLFTVPAPSLQLSHVHVAENLSGSGYSYFVQFIAGIWGRMIHATEVRRL